MLIDTLLIKIQIILFLKFIDDDGTLQVEQNGYLNLEQDEHEHESLILYLCEIIETL